MRQIITLIHDKKCVKQEAETSNGNFTMKLSSEISDSDSGFSDCEGETEVSGNQVEHSNRDFTMKS